MNANTGALTQNTGAPGTQFLSGTGFLPQLLLAIVLILILHVTLFAAEALYRQYQKYDKAVVDLMPLTYSAENRSYVINQDPFDPNSVPISLSDNERTGLEFSYSFHVFVNPSTFKSGEDALAHIFHKGYSRQYPLLAPGVYMRTNENTMRIYMNSAATWNNFIDIENFPVQKWAHVALVCRDNGLEVYVNGDLSKRIGFQGTVPYQNFGNFYAFSQRTMTLACEDMQGQCTINSLKGKSFRVQGAISGLLTRLRHFNYALSYTEIAGLVREGPNPKMAGQDENKPPYFVDTWWTTQYNQ